MVAGPGAWSPASARSRSPSNVGSSPNGSDGSGGDPSCRVSVAVRIRPLLGQELSDGTAECITADAYDRKQVVVGGGPDNRFTFDHVFSPQDRQAAIYQECVSPLVAAHMDGYNATILAYGQTGSGKTHTMGSASNLNVSEQDQGIIPRVIDELFRTLAARRQEDPSSSYRVSVQFLEIYGEEVKDLLNPLSPQRVAIREQPGGGIAVLGAREEAVGSAEEMVLVLERGTLSRTTGATLMNQTSSRSHAIFTVFLERRIARAGGDGEAAGGDGSGGSGGDSERTEVRKSKFHFVDLAGSERAKRTGAQGKRLKEGIEINKGLLVLGNVISALGDARKKGQHVPYRDSKLTRMLQDSLGGNSQTLMIACVSPAEVNLQESLNALRYANRARNIQNKPVLNRDRESMVVEELRQQVQALAAELLRLKQGGADGDGGSITEGALVRLLQGGVPCGTGAGGGHGGGGGMRGAAGAGKDEAGKALTQRCEIAEAEVQRLAEENARLRQQYSEASDEVIQLTADRDYYRLCLHDATGSGCGGSSKEGHDEPEAEDDTATDPSPLANQRGPFADHLRPYLHEIRALQHRVKELEQAQTQAAQQQQQQQNRRRSSASTFLFSSLLAEGAATAGAGGASTLLLPSLLLTAAEAGPQQPQPPQSQRQETDLEKDLRLATEAETGAFVRAHQEMSATVADLTRGIELKERLAAQLCESIKRYEVMRRVYEEKLQAMEEETARYEADREKLLHELEQLEKRLAASPGQKQAQHTQQQEALLRRIQEKEAQLQAATKKGEELGRLARQAQKTEGQLKQLNDEIAGMKRQKMDLLHKMDAERRKFQALLREKTQEIESMRRAAQRNAKEIQRLEQAVEKADKDRRKQEDDRNRLRAGTLALSSSSGDAAGLLALNRTTAAAAQRAQKVQGRRFSSAAADKLRYSEEERRTKKWLDARIREVAKREEAAERLAAEYQRRMALLKTKEDLEQARVRFFSTHRGGGLGATSTMATMATTTTTPRAMAAATTVRDVILLSQDALGAHGHGQEEGEGMGEGGGVEGVGPAPLTPEEEATLEELEGRIAACKAQLEFKDDRIRKFETIVNARSAAGAGSGGSGGGDGRLQVAKSCQTLEQSHAVIRVLFDMLVTTRREAKANGDRSQELEDACQRAAQLLESAEKRAEAERRLCEERLTRVATEYEEKISGLIDSAATSGLFVVPPAAVASAVAVVVDKEGRGDGAEGEGEQLRCMLRLSNERNEVLRAQMQQLQTTQEGLDARGADLEGRERRAREELRECQAQLKWAEFELTKVRSEYIKLRSERTLLATIHQQQDPLAGLLMLQRTTALASTSAASSAQAAGQQQQQQAQQQRQQQEKEEEVEKLEREVLGSGWDMEEEEDEEGMPFGPEDGDTAPVASAAEEGRGEGLDGAVMGTILEEDGPQDGEGESQGAEGGGDDDDEEEDGGGGSRAATPSWARDVTEDVHTHIKQGKAPPSIMNRQSVKRALQAISAAEPAGVEEAGAGAGASAGGAGAGGHGSIFDRLADPAHFTGIHKLHEEEAKANRQRVNRVRHNGEGIKKLLHAPQPKGGSLAASMYATHGARAAATAGHSQSPPSPPPLPLQQQQRHGSPSRCAAPPLVAASMRSPSPSVPSSSAEGMDVEAAEAVMVGRVMAVEELAEATAEEGEVGEEVLSAFQDPASALDARDGFAPIAESPEEDQEAEADAARAVAAEGEGDAPIQQLAVAAPAAAKQQEQQEQETPQDVLPTPLQQQPPQPRRKSLPTQVAAAAAAGEEEEEAAAAGMPVSDEGDDAAEAAALAPFPSEKGKVRKGFVSRMRKAFGLRR